MKTIPLSQAKEPWQMTYREFYDIAGSEYTAGLRFGLPTKQGGRLLIDPETGYPVKENLPEGRIRKAVVMKALREGKPVPPEVLADYPDLARMYAPDAAFAVLAEEQEKEAV